MKLFIDKGCVTCHNGVNVGGGMYARFGVVKQPAPEFLSPDDWGRFAVTKAIADKYAFKVPSLRNVELTAPYFHTGATFDLKKAVAVMGESQLGVATQRRRDRQDRRLPRRADRTPAGGRFADSAAAHRADRAVTGYAAAGVQRSTGFLAASVSSTRRRGANRGAA